MVEKSVEKTSLGVVKTSLGVMKTSLEVVKTSLGVVKTSLGVVKISLGVVKTSLEVVKTSLGKACMRTTHLLLLGLQVLYPSRLVVHDHAHEVCLRPCCHSISVSLRCCYEKSAWVRTFDRLLRSKVVLHEDQIRRQVSAFSR
jgi:hypothetical protein